MQTKNTTPTAARDAGQIVETRVYTASELQEHSPLCFKRAFNDYVNSNTEIPWQDETIDSLKACVAAAGITLEDWSLGAYNRGNHIRIAFRQDDAAELTGKRAMAWLENNLFSSLRVPWSGKGRTEIAKYGSGYRPGKIRPCPFTGYCADEDYLEHLQKAVRSGNTLKEAFESLAGVCERLLEEESEAQNTEDAFLDTAECNEWQFTENGRMF